MFEVGQKVLCVDDQITCQPLCGLCAGAVYTVKGVYRRMLSKAPMHVLLEECCTKHPVEPGYAVRRFRPLDDPFIEQFRKMARECDVPVRAWEGP